MKLIKKREKRRCKKRKSNNFYEKIRKCYKTSFEKLGVVRASETHYQIQGGLNE